MSYIDQTLGADETVFYRSKPHWIIFSGAVLWLLAALLIYAIGARFYFLNQIIFGYHLKNAVSLLCFLFAIYYGLIAYVIYISKEYGITNRRILVKAGLVSRSTLEILLNKVESIQVHQSILGRFLDYGSVVISGVGGSRDVFLNMPAPLKFRQAAQAHTEALRAGK